MKKWAWLLIAALLVSLAGGSLADETPVKIGVFEPLSGSRSAGGQMEYEGIQVAHALMPTVLGRPVELVPVDSQSSEEEAAAVAAFLVDTAQVDVVLGTWGSSLALAGVPAFERTRTPFIGTSCTNPQITVGNPYCFRVCYLDDFQGTLLASYAANSLGAKKAAILCDISSVYALGLRDFFMEGFGVENIVAEAYFTTGDRDFSQQLNVIMSLDPDVIFMPSDSLEPAYIMQQTRALGYGDVLFLGGDAWETDALIEIAGEAAEACRYTTFYDVDAEPSAEGERFLAKYAEMFGDKTCGAATAVAYDAYLAAIMAIEAAGTTDGPAVAAALQTLSFEGVTGSIAFDENGDAIKNQAVIKTVSDGAFAYVDTIVLEPDRP